VLFRSGGYGYNGYLSSPYYGGSYSYSYPSYSYSYPSYSYYDYYPSYGTANYSYPSYSYSTSAYQPSSAGMNSFSGDNVPQNQALLRVELPSPDARISLQGVAMDQGFGTQRLFMSPPLESGKTYTYTVRCTWMNGDSPITREQNIDVRAGQTATADFRQGGTGIGGGGSNTFDNRNGVNNTFDNRPGSNFDNRNFDNRNLDNRNLDNRNLDNRPGVNGINPTIPGGTNPDLNRGTPTNPGINNVPGRTVPGTSGTGTVPGTSGTGTVPGTSGTGTGTGGTGTGPGGTGSGSGTNPSGTGTNSNGTGGTGPSRP